MEYNANYTLVGLFVIILGTILLGVAIWLSAGLESKTYDTYEVYMNEPVSGLNEQAPVKFNGVTVGLVKSIRLNRLNPQQVSLLLDIERDTPINTSTVATLLSQGITGVTYIGLSAKVAKAPPLKAKPGQHYPVIPSQASFLVQLDQTIRDVAASVKKVSNALNRVLSPQNTEAFSQILHNTAVASKNFPAMVTSVNTAGTSVKQAMRQGGKAFDTLSNQALPPTVDFVQRMDIIAGNLQQLSRDLKNNPSVILRGKGSPKLGPGEH